MILLARDKLKIKKQNKFRENNLLHLNSTKSKKYLKWSTVLDFDNSIKFTVDWYKNYLKNKKNVYKYSLSQIFEYKKILEKSK